MELGLVKITEQSIFVRTPHDFLSRLPLLEGKLGHAAMQ